MPVRGIIARLGGNPKWRGPIDVPDRIDGVPTFCDDSGSALWHADVLDNGDVVPRTEFTHSDVQDIDAQQLALDWLAARRRVVEWELRQLEKLEYLVRHAEPMPFTEETP